MLENSLGASFIGVVDNGNIKYSLDTDILNSIISVG